MADSWSDLELVTLAYHRRFSAPHVLMKYFPHKSISAVRSKVQRINIGEILDLADHAKREFERQDQIKDFATFIAMLGLPKTLTDVLVIEPDRMYWAESLRSEGHE